MARPAGGQVWVLGRESRDFSNDELALSLSLQPLLTALDRMYQRSAVVTAAETDEQAQARELAHLTARQVDILSLIAAGLTADAIARVRRISILTVRKHLQNVYSKLGVSDRLLAVDHARRLGILPWPPELSRP
jgi:DNA-binding NarL/FixJ family response regulator